MVRARVEIWMMVAQRWMNRGGQGRPRNGSCAFAMLVLLFVCTVARGQDLDVSLSSRECLANEVMTLTVIIAGSQTHEPPVIPTIDDVIVQSMGEPRTSSFTSILNGRVTHRETVRYRYVVIPTQAGQFTIPPITAIINDEAYESPPTAFTAQESPTGDLLFVSVEAPESVYLGEPVDLTLIVRARVILEDEFTGGLRAAEHWRELMGKPGTNWGAFRPAIEALPDPRIRGRGVEPNPPVRQIMFDPGVDSEGNPAPGEKRYHQFELKQRVWPNRLGAFAPGDVRVVMQYPLRLNARGGIAASRPVAATATIDSILVKEAPEAGRPDSFTGAIGRFRIETAARPTDVTVGDPITLTMTVVDQRPGQFELDLLQPPALEATRELASHFKIPTDPMSGVVEQNRKTFTQTIRPTLEGITAIPAIAFAFFDPATEQYHIAMSEPIAISVAAASSMAMTDIVGADEPTSESAAGLTAFAGGILANHSTGAPGNGSKNGGGASLLEDQAFQPSSLMIIVLAAPPVLFLLVLVSHRRVYRMRTDTAYARRRSAHRVVTARLAAAQRLERGEQADAVAAALCGYIADRFDLPPGAETRGDVVERLEQAGVNDDLLADVQDVLSQSEAARYAGGDDAPVDLPGKARACIDQLQRERME